MSQLAFYFSADGCISCKTCVIACKDKNNLKVGRKFRKIYTCSSGSWTLLNGVYTPSDVSGYSLSVSCNHCETPACKAICPAGAIQKREDGIVFIDQSLCIGCGSCIDECPYGAPSKDPITLKVDKCDFCRDIILTSDKPACVAACPMRCLDYGDIEDLRRKYPDAVNTVYPLPDPSVTGPSLLITGHRDGDAPGTVTYNMPEEIETSEYNT